MWVNSLRLTVPRHVLPWVSAASIALGAMVVLPGAAMAGFDKELTDQGQHSCSEPAVRLVGCDADSSHARAQTGMVAGTVQLLACGGPPPIGVPRPCIFRPVAGAQIARDSGGRTATRVFTDTGGRYSVRVASGIYKVHLVSPQSLAMLASPRTLKVAPRQSVQVDFRLIFMAL
jgi:hypothetical protein